jgi:hypothetical protein
MNENHRRRIHPVPFLAHNDTDCPLWRSDAARTTTATSPENVTYVRRKGVAGSMMPSTDPARVIDSSNAVHLELTIEKRERCHTTIVGVEGLDPPSSSL